jgi:uncharacterized protein
MSLTYKTSSKLDHLKNILYKMDKIVIAYSGGVDSTLLSKVAYDVLKEKALVVLAKSQLLPLTEIEYARQLADDLKFNFIEIEFNPFIISSFIKNSSRRCYYCKKYLIDNLKQISTKKGISYICDGSNSDDLKEHRPGLKALIESGVRIPLAESNITKNEVRVIAHEKGLPNWNKPPMSCLATRIPYGTTITPNLLKCIDEGESFLNNFHLQSVRLRHHGKIARIEVDDADWHIFSTLETRKKINKYLKSLGFTYVSVDLQGYRSGSLNEAL